MFKQIRFICDDGYLKKSRTGTPHFMGDSQTIANILLNLPSSLFMVTATATTTAAAAAAVMETWLPPILAVPVEYCQFLVKLVPRAYIAIKQYDA